MPKKTVSYKDASRVEWSTTVETEEGRQPYPGLDRINTGCLQRIADATEAMAKNYLQLQEELDNYKRWLNEEQDRRIRLNKEVTNLQRVKTRYKNQLDKLKNQQNADN